MYIHLVSSIPLPLLHLPTAPCGMHAAVAVDQRHIRSEKLRPLIVPSYARRPAWQAWRGLCFHMSGPREWVATKAYLGWRGGEGELLSLQRLGGGSEVVNSRW